MKDIKYTTDGKKVVVIGNLNNNQKIVQEIFVSGDSEIPSGEQFVVSSLHDAPIESWKEKELRNLNARYESEKKRLQDAIESMDRNLRNIRVLAQGKIDYLRKLASKCADDALDQAEMVLMGKVKWVVEVQYTPKLTEYKDFVSTYNRDELAILTLYGRDDGTMRWGVGTYTDRSGGDRMKCLFYEDKKPAIAKMKELISALDYVSEERLKLAGEYGVTLNAELVAAYKEKTLSDLNENLRRQIESVEKTRDRIAKAGEL